MENVVEKPLHPKGIADRYGYSADDVRAWCNRGEGNHPLPHIKSGGKRPVLRIRPSVFEKWRDEEEQSPRAWDGRRRNG